MSTFAAIDHKEMGKATGVVAGTVAVTVSNINLYIQIAAGLGGLVFLYFQIRKARLEVKLRERELRDSDGFSVPIQHRV